MTFRPLQEKLSSVEKTLRSPWWSSYWVGHAWAWTVKVRSSRAWRRYVTTVRGTGKIYDITEEQKTMMFFSNKEVLDIRKSERPVHYHSCTHTFLGTPADLAIASAGTKDPTRLMSNHQPGGLSLPPTREEKMPIHFSREELGSGSVEMITQLNVLEDVIKPRIEVENLALPTKFSGTPLGQEGAGAARQRKTSIRQTIWSYLKSKISAIPHCNIDELKVKSSQKTPSMSRTHVKKTCSNF